MSACAENPADAYHRWYYDSEIWKQTTYKGVPIQKWVGDLWNYQEVIYRLRPRLIVEFGSYHGGSALYFADLVQQMWPEGKVLSVDIDLSAIHETARTHPAIEWMQASTADPIVADQILRLRGMLHGPVFFIIDSDHTKQHVLAEMENIRHVAWSGDYVVVEDGNINGHPVLPGWGAGPFEALEEYFSRYPADYQRDEQQERKFGFTFAPKGYLVRC